MQNRILVLLVHPLFEKSRMHKSLVNHIPEGVTVHDLYQEYPDFNIDIKREQKLLLNHDIIIWQHPVYWYSCPALLKQWIDIVLEAGWAYGPNGKALEGKVVMQVLSTGGARSTYQPEGYHHFTLKEFLTPFNRTTTLCNMQYLPPFAGQGSHRISDDELLTLSRNYAHLLDYLQHNRLDVAEFQTFEYLNDWLLKDKIA
ncbi:NAD(P)H oxidoreductase [Dyadobacter luteus]|jgi:glutathione-regulated potassium-efflux system ancillary protein KefG|uniref:NAD(P)H oxidoreductase n=1 Tax=Dyadobacter luteus TaxID=2259619 RepID=A0A3D8YHB6_9BACT|nr:NAD(P)H-dependent oxidoreductase [Dyadobacter luteus]REA64216.1 NAD(P)H oxidoreductase [Dyadobacter luteus]